MKNCLVTKLKESVQNDNLPVYDTIFLDFVESSDPQQFTVGAGNEDVTVTFAGIVTLGGATGTSIPANTLVTVPSGTRHAFYTVSNQPSVEKFVKIENIYNLESLISAGFTGFILNQTAKSGLPSLLYAKNLVQFGGIMDDVSIFNCKKLRLRSSDSSQEFRVGGNTIQCLTGDTNNSFVTEAPDTVVRSTIRLAMNIADFPAQLRYYRSHSGRTYGELTDFVIKARAAGRTSGYLALWWVDSGYFCLNITFNGVSLKNNVNVTPVTIDNTPCAILQWNSSTIGFATSKPSDFSQYEGADSDYGWQPYT